MHHEDVSRERFIREVSKGDFLADKSHRYLNNPTLWEYTKYIAVTDV